MRSPANKIPALAAEKKCVPVKKTEGPVVFDPECAECRRASGLSQRALRMKFQLYVSPVRNIFRRLATAAVEYARRVSMNCAHCR